MEEIRAKLSELLEEEEIYIMSLIHATEKVDSEKVKENAKGIKLYYERIRERIVKEIINGNDFCNAPKS